jgi:hypothetical protein
MRQLQCWCLCAGLIGAIALGPWNGASQAAAFQAAGSKPGGIRACSLFTQAEIKKVYGAKWQPVWDQIRIPPNESPLPGGGSECSMMGLDIQLDAVQVSRFEANRQAYAARSKFERIMGVGDEAWFYEQGAGTSVHIIGVYARSGQHVYVLSLSVRQGETAASLRPVVIAAGEAAAAKLR